VGHGLEAMLQEESMGGVLGVLQNTEEDWALDFVLILAE
jgi:hypothetical protein